MQFTTTIITALFAGLGMASIITNPLLERQLSAYPACAQTCLTNGKSSCARTDAACLCKDTAFQAGVTTCVESSCSFPDQLASRNAQTAACGN